MKRIFDIIFTAVMVVVITLAVLLAGVRLFGLTPYTVISGSMEPKYPVGSLIYVKKVGIKDLKVDDVITYVIDGGTVVTHRIIEIIPDEDNPTVVRYRTKGDANKDADGEPVHINNVLGKAVFNIPLLGYVTYYIQNPPGSYIATGALMVLVLLSFLPGLLKPDEPVKDQAGEEEIEKTKELVNELKAMREALAQKQSTTDQSKVQGTEDPKTDDKK